MSGYHPCPVIGKTHRLPLLVRELRHSHELVTTGLAEDPRNPTHDELI